MVRYINETLKVANFCQCGDFPFGEVFINALKLHSTDKLALLVLDGEVVTSVDITLTFVIFFTHTMDSAFLILHLLAFFLSGRKKTLPEKNVACFSVTLLATHVFLITGLVFRGSVCRITSVVSYYFFVAYFFWMLVMSFDAWRSMRAACRLRLNEDGENRKFIIYSLFSWSASAIFSSIPVAGMNLPEKYVSLRPKMYNVLCGLEYDDTLMWIVTFTIGVVMLPNFILFIDTSRLISKKEYESTLGDVPLCLWRRGTNSGQNDPKNMVLNMRRFISLTVQAGLIWIIAVALNSISFISRTFVWYVSIIFVSSQGIFIFGLFTCRNKFLSVVLS